MSSYCLSTCVYVFTSVCTRDLYQVSSSITLPPRFLRQDVSLNLLLDGAKEPQISLSLIPQYWDNRQTAQCFV